MTFARIRQAFCSAALRTALCLTALAVPTAARADRLDRELIRTTNKVIERIKSVGGAKSGDAKSVNVGVLKFRAGRDDAKDDFHLGPINNVMADRLENTLILGYN